MTERQVPSVAVAVARDGRIVWEEAFGWADRENRVAGHAAHPVLARVDLQADHRDRR